MIAVTHSRPITPITISYSINHLNLYSIDVAPHLTFKQFQKRIHQAINAISREHLYPLIEATLPQEIRNSLRQRNRNKSLEMTFPNSIRLDKADNKNCVIVFPIYPARHEPETLSDKEQAWISTVQIHGCRCDRDVELIDLTQNWPRDELGALRPLNVIYTPCKQKLPSFSVRKYQGSNRFDLDSIASLVHVQRRHPRTVVLPIHGLPGQMEKVYVRDAWVDYSNGMTERFKLSKGVVGIDSPIPHAVYNEDSEIEDDVINEIPALSRVPPWVEADPKSTVSFKDFLKINPSSNYFHTNYYVEGHPGTGKTEMQFYFLYRLIHSFARLIIVFDCIGLPPLFIKVDKTESKELVVEELKRDRSQFQNVDYFPVIGLFDSVKPETKAFFTYVGSPPFIKKHEPRHWNVNVVRFLLSPMWTKKEFWSMLRLVYPPGTTPWIRKFPKASIDLHSLSMRRVLLSLPSFDAADSPLNFRTLVGALAFRRSRAQERLRARTVETQLGWNPLHLAGTPLAEKELRQTKELAINVIDLFGLIPRALNMDAHSLLDCLRAAVLPNPQNDINLSLAQSCLVATASDRFPISLFSNLLFLDDQLDELDIPQQPGAWLIDTLSDRGFQFVEQVLYSMTRQRRVVTIHTLKNKIFNGHRLVWPLDLGLRQVTWFEATGMRVFEPNKLYVQSSLQSSGTPVDSPLIALDGFFWQPHDDANLFCAVQITNSPDVGTPDLAFFQTVYTHFKTNMTRHSQKPVDCWFLWIVPHDYLEAYLHRRDVDGIQLVGVVSANELILQQITGEHPEEVERSQYFREDMQEMRSQERRASLSEEDEDENPSSDSGDDDTDGDSDHQIRKRKRLHSTKPHTNKSLTKNEKLKKNKEQPGHYTSNDLTMQREVSLPYFHSVQPHFIRS
ncbi:hypothetical protein BLNAU_17601 [Blattamonas nauphoetae]|uniref:Uncharacterized protein n=1 Tax=Blattamonas nauphoetae TaxID=2049346 RepID=A0ABQ9X6P4_9EUKA|nr:hypothetical protein BLNAU_17601 [Blattamonas nauphoetae]